jgi:hypothetical protein
MKRSLLILSLILMTASLTAPFWSRWMTRVPPQRITGHVTGEFADRPWDGATIHVGDERSILNADGKFDFAVAPGVYVLKVCCSDRFEPIRREIRVTDDTHVELHADPIMEIPGQLIVPKGTQLNNPLSVSVRRLFTKAVKLTPVSANGAFSLHLSKGDWKVSVENASPKLTLKSITFGKKPIPDETLTISKNQEPALLEITLQ